jgi:hypothetical protein
MPPKPIPVKMERARLPEIATRAMAVEREDREASSCVLRMGTKGHEGARPHRAADPASRRLRGDRIAAHACCTSPRAERISGPETFRSSARKDFFNSIGTNRTNRVGLMMSVVRGRREVAFRGCQDRF